MKNSQFFLDYHLFNLTIATNVQRISQAQRIGENTKKHTKSFTNVSSVAKLMETIVISASTCIFIMKTDFSNATNALRLSKHQPDYLSINDITFQKSFTNVNYVQRLLATQDR